MDGLVGVKVVLWIAYSNKKFGYMMLPAIFQFCFFYKQSFLPSTPFLKKYPEILWGLCSITFPNFSLF
jgi:hypothetical protein